MQHSHSSEQRQSNEMTNVDRQSAQKIQICSALIKKNHQPFSFHSGMGKKQVEKLQHDTTLIYENIF